jgi:hypothetical protein
MLHFCIEGTLWQGCANRITARPIDYNRLILLSRTKDSVHDVGLPQPPEQTPKRA